MRQLKFMVVLSALFLLSSCIPTSEQPISDPALAQQDERLMGLWEAIPLGDANVSDENEGPVFLHIVPAQEPFVDVLEVESLGDGIDVSLYSVFVSVIDSRHFMNIQESVVGQTESEKPQPYLFAKYTVSKDNVLSVWVLGITSYLQQAVETGKIAGKVYTSASATCFSSLSLDITDTSVHIAEFLRTADDKELFSITPLRFRKIRDLRRSEPIKPQETAE